MSVIPTKDIVYLILLIAVIVGMAWWHHDTVLEVRAADDARAREAVAQQHIKDAQAAQDVIDELNEDKLNLQAQLDAQSPPVVHKCGRVWQVDRPMRPSPSTAGAQPGEPAERSADTALPAGSGGGDVGPGVRALAEAGQLDAIYYARLYEWAVKTR